NLLLLEVFRDGGNILADVNHEEVRFGRNNLIAPGAQVLDRLLPKIDCHLLDILFIQRVLECCYSAVLNDSIQSAAATGRTQSLDQVCGSKPVAETHAGERGNL